MSWADLERGLKELAAAEDAYSDAEAYYNGSNPEQYASVKLRRALRAYEAKFRLRFARVPVDAVANRLEVASVVVNRLDNGDDGEGADEDPTDKRLTQRLQDEVRDANDLEVVEAETFEMVSKFGDAYWILDYDEVSNEVSIYLNTPYECRVFYDASGRYKQFAIKVWEEYDPDELGRATKLIRATLFYEDAIEEYRTYPGDDGTDITHWLPYGEGSPFYNDRGEMEMEDDGETPYLEPGIYPYGFGQVPVFHFRTNRPYGRPEHEAAYGPQDMIDKLIITQMATIDFQGFPQRFAIQDANAQTEAAQDWTTDEEGDDTITVSEGEAKFKAGPGEMWWIEGAKMAGQFEVANADAFLKPLTHYVRGMSTITDTPLHLFDVQGQPPTGESRRTAEAGMTRRIRRRQRSYGGTEREAHAYALALLTDGDFIELRERIEVGWLPAESIDPNEQWELAGKKKGVSLPLGLILEEAGYSPDAIKRIEEMALAEREEVIRMQRETFQASMQNRRDDRPDTGNPQVGDKPGDDQGGTS